MNISGHDAVSHFVRPSRGLAGGIEQAILSFVSHSEDDVGYGPVLALELPSPPRISPLTEEEVRALLGVRWAGAGRVQPAGQKVTSIRFAVQARNPLCPAPEG